MEHHHEELGGFHPLPHYGEEEVDGQVRCPEERRHRHDCGEETLYLTETVVVGSVNILWVGCTDVLAVPVHPVVLDIDCSTKHIPNPSEEICYGQKDQDHASDRAQVFPAKEGAYDEKTADDGAQGGDDGEGDIRFTDATGAVAGSRPVVASEGFREGEEVGRALHEMI